MMRRPPLRFRPRRAALIAVAAASAAACATLQRARFQPPDVMLEHLAITGLGLGGGTLRLTLAVANPNTYTLHVLRTAVVLDLEDTRFGDAQLERRVALPAGDTTLVEVPMTFTWEGVGAAGRALLGRGSVQYRLTGRLIADTPVGERGIEIGRGGTVTLVDLVR